MADKDHAHLLFCSEIINNLKATETNGKQSARPPKMQKHTHEKKEQIKPAHERFYCFMVDNCFNLILGIVFFFVFFALIIQNTHEQN